MACPSARPHPSCAYLTLALCASVRGDWQRALEIVLDAVRVLDRDFPDSAHGETLHVNAATFAAQAGDSIVARREAEIALRQAREVRQPHRPRGRAHGERMGPDHRRPRRGARRARREHRALAPGREPPIVRDCPASTRPSSASAPATFPTRRGTSAKRSNDPTRGLPPHVLRQHLVGDRDPDPPRPSRTSSRLRRHRQHRPHPRISRRNRNGPTSKPPSHRHARPSDQTSTTRRSRPARR